MSSVGLEYVDYIEFVPDVEGFEYRVLDLEDDVSAEGRILLEQIESLPARELDVLLLEQAIEVSPDTDTEEALQEAREHAGKSRKALAFF